MTTAASLLLLTSVAAFAQNAEPAAFEVASIRSVQPGRESIESVPGSVNLRNARLLSCIRWAYNLQEVQISGPPWLNDVWFDIWAKAATPAKDAELRQMLQVLLAQRFHLAAHRETKELSTLILTVAKNGHKMEPAADGPPSFQPGKLTITGRSATVAQLVEFFSKELREPIVDRTGLDGRFNYFLDINSYFTEETRKGGPDGGPPPDASNIVSQALQAQLGLKLDSKKAPIEMLIIDRVEKVPTEN